MTLPTRKRPGRVIIAPLNHGQGPSDEQIRIAALVGQHDTLLAVSVAIGVNAGYLSAIRTGRRRASNRARIALGLPPRRVLADACGKCGGVHITRRCPSAHPRTRLSASVRRMTVGVWAGDYETWRERNLAEIEKIVEWAEKR